MDINQAMEFIHAVSWKGSRPGLSRITQLLALCGNPQNDLTFVHVAGTNGKGSFCAMLSTILCEAGYKTGLFVSPYVLRFSERMRINGEEISDEDLAEIITQLAPFCDKMEDAPTEFELITAAAFLYFQKKKCDIVVLEAGLGGRLDSTNVILPPLLSVITGIAMDHAAVLGDTVEKIAAEKAGIIKCGSKLLYGGNDQAAYRVIAEKAKACGVKPMRVNHDLLRVEKSDLNGSVISFDPFSHLTVSLAGAYQPRNAATVLTAVSMLKESGLHIDDDAVARGLEKVKWPARFEVLKKEPPIVYDGGHNPQGVLACMESVELCFPHQKVLMLCGVMEDKEYETMADILSPRCAYVLTVTPDNPRALSGEKLCDVFARRGVAGESFASVKEAVNRGFALAKEQNMPLVVLGSLYMYAAFREAFDPLG